MFKFLPFNYIKLRYFTDLLLYRFNGFMMLKLKIHILKSFAAVQTGNVTGFQCWESGSNFFLNPELFSVAEIGIICFGSESC